MPQVQEVVVCRVQDAQRSLIDLLFTQLVLGQQGYFIDQIIMNAPKRCSKKTQPNGRRPYLRFAPVRRQKKSLMDISQGSYNTCMVFSYLEHYEATEAVSDEDQRSVRISLLTLARGETWREGWLTSRLRCSAEIKSSLIVDTRLMVLFSPFHSDRYP